MDNNMLLLHSKDMYVHVPGGYHYKVHMIIYFHHKNGQPSNPLLSKRNATLGLGASLTPYGQNVVSSGSFPNFESYICPD